MSPPALGGYRGEFDSLLCIRTFFESVPKNVPNECAKNGVVSSVGNVSMECAKECAKMKLNVPIFEFSSLLGICQNCLLILI
jgi:hypothetical protein